jgi:predicted enzyme related to lactoylglutathione lyase
MEITRHEPGMFSWADLATPDREGSTKFYTELLGLEATEMPVGGGVVYVTLSKGGKNVCAIYEMGEEMKGR